MYVLSMYAVCDAVSLARIWRVSIQVMRVSCMQSCSADLAVLICYYQHSQVVTGQITLEIPLNKYIFIQYTHLDL